MKKIFISTILILSIFCMCGCEKKQQVEKKPDLTQIRSICNLATLEAYYHNVAKYEKEADSGITHLFEKDREMWIEYTGVAKIGIDMSKVTMKVEGETIKIFIPKAKLLNIDIGEINKDSYIYSDDGWNKNEFTPEEETKAINKAQNEMKKNVENNSQLLLSAQTRAQKLIEKYIKQLGDLSGTSYKIEWEFETDSESK